MIEAEVATTIRCPRYEVAAVMFRPEREPAWIGGVVQVRVLYTGPLQRGARFERTSNGPWNRSVSALLVTDYVPDRLLELRAEHPFEQRVRYTLEGIPEGAIARIEIARSAGTRLHLPASVGAVLLRRAIIADLDRLKELVEAGGNASRAVEPIPAIRAS